MISCLAIALFEAKCSAGEDVAVDEPSIAYKYGLSEVTRNRDIAEQAVELANDVLGNATAIRLVPSWKRRCVGDEVPVYMLSGEGLGRYEIIFVPPGEYCIFINASEVDNVLSYLNSDSLSPFPVKIEAAVALMLLHEVGHIYYGDFKSESKLADFNIEDLTKKAKYIQNKEIRADLFAVDCISAPYEIGEAFDRIFSSTILSMAIGNISVNSIMLKSSESQMMYNVDSIRENMMFRNQDALHPNLELRFMVMSYALHPNEASLLFLEAVINWRTGKTKGIVLKRPKYDGR